MRRDALFFLGGGGSRSHPTWRVRSSGRWLGAVLWLATAWAVPIGSAEPAPPLRLLAPVVSGAQLSLGVEGGAPGQLYDVFGTTHLGGGALWRWQLRSAFAGQTSFSLEAGPGFPSFFMLGTLLDSDGEGLTDAFEGLVTGTEADTADTDGDEVDDFVEYLQGRNPRAGAVPDMAGAVGLRVFTPLP